MPQGDKTPPAPIVALCGGVGAARFLDGLTRVVPPSAITVIGNTGDDFEIHGLHISPDLDTVTYTLAGLSDRVQGWGIRNDTHHCLEFLARYTGESWFQLGDRDLATHIFRTSRLRAGETLAQVTGKITGALGVVPRILPVTNDRLQTWVHTAEGMLSLQEYFVQKRAEPEVRRVEFRGAPEASPAPGVLEAIGAAHILIVAPSNPILSIGPILAVPGVRQALAKSRAPVVAVSPIIGGRAVKGPAATMMRSMGLEPSARQVAELYLDFLDVLVLDEEDRDLERPVRALGLSVVVTETVMNSRRVKESLARAVMGAVPP